MTAYSDKDDNTLVELTLLGEDRAYEELVIRHERAVKRTAYKVTGLRTREAYEEAVRRARENKRE